MNNSSEEFWIRNIRCGETSKLQFKLRLDKNASVAAEMIAFANSKGGTILFGVEDKRGEIVGLTYEEIQETSREIGNIANDYVRPTIYLQTEVLILEDKNILAAHIEEGINKPYKDTTGAIWVKQGADKRRVTENSETLRLFSESGNYKPDSAIVEDCSFEDLDPRKIDEYLVQIYGKDSKRLGMPQKKLMQNLKLVNANGKVSLAALLFFGYKPQDIKPVFCIKAVSFFGNDSSSTDYRDSKDITGTIPEMFDAAMRFLDLNLYHIQAGQNFNKVGILEVSKIALEEVLQNALVHREYIVQSPIRLMIYNDRVEIISPGGLPDGLTVEDIKCGTTVQRNPLIAKLCSQLMFYRGLGTGIGRAMQEEDNIEFVNTTRQFTTIFRRDVSLVNNGDECVYGNIRWKNEEPGMVGECFPPVEYGYGYDDEDQNVPKEDEKGFDVPKGSIENVPKEDKNDSDVPKEGRNDSKDVPKEDGKGFNVPKEDIKNVPKEDKKGSNVPKEDKNASNIPKEGRNDSKNVPKEDITNVSKDFLERKETILRLIMQQPTITQDNMSKIIGVSRKTLQRDLDVLSKNGIIKRMGGRKEGYWKVLNEDED